MAYLAKIQGFDDYLATRAGKVISLKQGRAAYLKPHTGRLGYQRVTLHQGGRARLLLHRLLLKAFVGPPPSGMECRHLDGNRSNNRLDNLCWGTRKENYQDRIRHGHHGKRWGEDNQAAKLSNAQVDEMRGLRKRGWKLRPLAKRFGINHLYCGQICLGRRRPIKPCPSFQGSASESGA